MSHHEELVSCSGPSPETHKDGIIDLMQDTNGSGPTSVVCRPGESWSALPCATYVSPYIPIAQNAGVSEAVGSNPVSTSTERNVSNTSIPRLVPSRHDEAVPHVNEKRPKSVRSDTSSVDTDLETTIPQALIESKDIRMNKVSPQRFPSAATQSEEPFTQVKQTPYVNEQLAGLVNSHTAPPVLPSQVIIASPSTASGTKLEHEAPPQPSISEVSGTEGSISHDDSVKANEVRFMNVVVGNLNETMAATQIKAEVDVQPQKSDNVESPHKKRKISGIDNVVIRSISESASSDSFPFNDNMSSPESRSAFEIKQTSFETPLLSPNVNKRRKRMRAPKSFGFSQDIRVAEDPSILARAYRQEFLASRKSSTSEQSDIGRKAVNSPRQNGSDSVVLHNQQAAFIQDGDPSSKPDLSGILTDTDVSSNLSPLGNPSPVKEPNIQFTFAENDDDVVISVESQDVPVKPETPSLHAQDRNVWGTIEGIHQNRDNTDDATTRPSEVSKDQDFSTANESVPTISEDSQVSKTNEITSPAPRANDLQEGIGLGSGLSDSQHPKRSHTDEAAASMEAQAGQVLEDPANESLLSEQQLNFNSYASASNKKIAEAPVIAKSFDTQGNPDVVMVDANPQIAIEVQESFVSEKSQLQSLPLEPATIFEQFKISYPGYVGNEERFVAICKKIGALIQQDRMEHRSLWDDFIIRHAVEYPLYLQRCALKAEDPLPYERFYRNEIEEPEFTKHIITPKNLQEILGISDQRQTTSPPQQQTQSPAKSVCRDVTPKPGPKSPMKPASLAVSSPRPDFSPATIDLTNDSETSVSSTEIHETTRSSQKRSRPLPWVNFERDDERSSPKRRNIITGNAVSSHRSSPSLRPTLKAPSLTPTERPGSLVAQLKEIATVSPLLSRTSTKIQPRHTQRPSGPGTPSKSAEPTRPSHAKTPLPPTIRPQGTATAVPKTAKAKKSDFWKDTDSPFKKFAKAYGAVCPGNGNSYAAVSEKESTAAQKQAKTNFKSR